MTFQKTLQKKVVGREAVQEYKVKFLDMLKQVLVLTDKDFKCQAADEVNGLADCEEVGEGRGCERLSVCQDYKAQKIFEKNLEDWEKTVENFKKGKVINDDMSKM